MPPAYRVILQPRAFENLDAIFDYIKHDSPQNAIAMVDRLWAAANSLDHLPHRYKVHHRSKNPAKVIRSMPEPPFVIYYNVIEQPRTVRILAIRHGARRPPRRFD
jgi:plasmid stabilization system protein ParE